MKTLILQSNRTENVPGWIDTCMRSEVWAKTVKLDHVFLDAIDKLMDTRGQIINQYAEPSTLSVAE